MAKRKPLSVDGTEYPVLDRLGWQASSGVYAVEVETPGGPRMAVSPSRSGPYRFWGVADRVAPVLEALASQRAKPGYQANGAPLPTRDCAEWIE